MKLLRTCADLAGWGVSGAVRGTDLWGGAFRACGAQTAKWHTLLSPIAPQVQALEKSRAVARILAQPKPPADGSCALDGHLAYRRRDVGAVAVCACHDWLGPCVRSDAAIARIGVWVLRRHAFFVAVVVGVPAPNT